jgi:hypothetical protein
VTIRLRREPGVQRLLSAITPAAMQIEHQGDVGATSRGCGYVQWHFAIQTTGMHRHNLPAKARAWKGAACGGVTESRHQQERTRQASGDAAHVEEPVQSSQDFLPSNQSQKCGARSIPMLRTAKA